MSNSSAKWSALIYGRTYEVDFRLIAMPEYFNKDVKASAWAENYILATTQIPEKLPGSPRWSLFTNEKYCVFGTTCMVRELFPDGFSEEVPDITRDFRGRPLYAFIGYVAERDESGKFPPLPAYSDLKLEKFQLLYEKYVGVSECWNVKPYQPESRKPTVTKSQENVKFSSSTSNDSKLQINLDQKIIKVWSKNHESDVWNTVIQEIEISHQPMSVCLSLSTPRYAENSPFLNATVLRLDTSRDGLDLEKYVDKPPKEIQQQAPSTQCEEAPKNFANNGIGGNESETYDSNFTGTKIKKLIFGISIYFFDKQAFDINNFFHAPKAKIKQFEKSLKYSFTNSNLDGIYSFFEDEYKQFTDREKKYKEDIEELEKVTSLNKRSIEDKLKSIMDETSDPMKIIDNMFHWVCDSTSIREKKQQDQSSDKNSEFGFKTITDDNPSKTDANKSKHSQRESNPNKNGEWF